MLWKPVGQCFILAIISNHDESVKSPTSVIPALNARGSQRRTGIHKHVIQLDPRLRGDDKAKTKQTFF